MLDASKTLILTLWSDETKILHLAANIQGGFGYAFSFKDPGNLARLHGIMDSVEYPVASAKKLQLGCGLIIKNRHQKSTHENGSRTTE